MTTRDDLVKGLGAHARARAHEVRALEHTLRANVDPAATERILQALAAGNRGVAAPTGGSRSRGRWPVALVPLAMAASVALAMRASSTNVPAAPVGEYSVTVDGRAEVQRAARDGVATALEARDGSLQRVTVRPRMAVSGRVAATVLVVGAAVAVADGVEPEVSDLGVVRFEVPGEILARATEVRVVIAPAAQLAAATSAAVAGGLPPSPRGPGAAVVVRIPVEAPDENK